MYSSEKNLIIKLNSPYTAPTEEIGGKAHSLIKMTNLNLPVPPGIVLTVSFFSSWIEQIKQTEEWNSFLNNINNLPQCETILTKIKKLSYNNLSLSDIQKEQIENVLSSENIQYKHSIYAVRSSSPEEDLEGASFAGGYETFLGVSYNDLELNIKKAFISAFDFRIFKYKKEKGLNVKEVKIAIIIMKQIKSDFSGVGFSLNPINNDYDEAVITSNYGLGESVVGGIISPDQYIVNKISKTIIDRKIGKKEKIALLSKDNKGTFLQDISNDMSSKSSLEDKYIIELVEKIEFIEKEYKCPIDIEFAIEEGKLYLLQARPITTYHKLPFKMMTQPKEKRQLYGDITLIVQGFTKPLSIMGSSILKRLANEVGIKFFGSYNIMQIDDSVVDMVGGKLFFNLSQLWAKFPKPSFENFILNINSKFYNIIRTFDNEYTNEQIPYKINFSKMGMFWRLPVFRFYFSNWFASSNIANFKYYGDKTYEYTKYYINQYEQKKISFNTMIDLIADYLACFFRDCVFPIMPNALNSYQHLRKLFEPYMDNEDVKNNLVKVVQSLPNVTNIMGNEMFKLSILCEEGKYQSCIEFKEDYANGKLSNEFYNKLKSYLDKYGCRGQGELDICNERGEDKIDLMLEQIYTMSKRDKWQPSPIQIFEEAEKNRPFAYNKLLDFAKKNGFEYEYKNAYNFTMTYLPYRESPKYYIIRLIGEIRKVLIRIYNNILLPNGLLNSIDELWSLSLESIGEILKSPNDYNKEKVDEMRKNDNIDRDVFLSWTRVPFVFDSRGRILTIPKPKALNDNEYIGETVSWGKVRGKAKVISYLGEKEFLPGEILVTRATDPGWTPLIISSGGLVLEVGGMLQHGALVSREFNKPCVVGIDNVLNIIKDGDEVEVDAIEGTVRIVNKGK